MICVTVILYFGLFLSPFNIMSFVLPPWRRPREWPKQVHYFFIINQLDALISRNLFLDWNSTCFGQFLCPSSGVFHCIHSNGVCHTVLLTVCSEKLLMMDRGTVRNM